MCIYVAAAIIMYRRTELLKLECDLSVLHAFLQHFPQNLPFDEILPHALRLFQQFPPEQLQTKSKLSLKPGSICHTYPFDYMDNIVHTTYYERMRRKYLQLQRRRSLLGKAFRMITWVRNKTKGSYIPIIVLQVSILLGIGLKYYSWGNSGNAG